MTPPEARHPSTKPPEPPRNLLPGVKQTRTVPVRHQLASDARLRSDTGVPKHRVGRKWIYDLPFSKGNRAD